MQRLLVGVMIYSTALAAYAQQPHQHDHAQFTAPVGVMGNHIHEQGQWMFSYNYMNMNMDGNRDGTNEVSPQQIFSAGYMVAPLSMTMEMYMFGAMYGVTDTVSMMLMAPYIKNEMDHITMMNMPFTTRSEGLGDVKLSSAIALLNQHDTQVLLNAGLSLPTGSIDERDTTPMMANAKLPYPMQLGSGTYDLLLGASYNGKVESWQWGAQALATLRTGSNDNQYTLGDKIEVTGWLVRKFASAHSTSVRLSYNDWDNIDGADPDLNPNLVPTADPNRRAGSRADLSLGYRFTGQPGAMRGHSLGIEYSLPVYQNLDGPQLETDNILYLSWQYTL